MQSPDLTEEKTQIQLLEEKKWGLSNRTKQNGDKYLEKMCYFKINICFPEWVVGSKLPSFEEAVHLRRAGKPQ